MDTNYPAGTPREGYPVEIQVLWIRLLRQLEKISGQVGVHASACPPDKLKLELQQKWRDLADHATASFEKYFWCEDQGWFADVLLAQPGVSARDAIRDDALRSNCLFAVSLGLGAPASGTASWSSNFSLSPDKRKLELQQKLAEPVLGAPLIRREHAQCCVAAAEKFLVVPGALRSLAPLPVSVPLLICGNDGRQLNDPPNPYWPRYEGDEDTRRKPAYHNGTAWTWTFPTFCEALAAAWDFSPEAVAAAKSYLGSAEKILNEGCLGQIPEILDGDAPHTQRGCDAQAWGVTESLRVWKMLAEQ